MAGKVEANCGEKDLFNMERCNELVEISLTGICKNSRRPREVGI